VTISHFRFRDGAPKGQQPIVFVVVEDDVVVGHGDVDDVVTLLHRSFDPSEMAEHDVNNDQLTRAVKKFNVIILLR
jgi:hypothetical protein